MPPRLRVLDLVLDLRAFNSFRRRLLDGAKIRPDTNAVDAAMKRGSRMYLEWLRRRYIENSMSGGKPEWPDIEEKTKDIKASRGYDPDLILRESDTVMDSMEIARDKETGGFEVGYVGPLSERTHPGHDTRLSVRGLAEVLQDFGVRNGKTWDIIVPPDAEVRNNVYQMLRDGLSMEIGRANRANKR